MALRLRNIRSVVQWSLRLASVARTRSAIQALIQKQTTDITHWRMINSSLSERPLSGSSLWRSPGDIWTLFRQPVIRFESFALRNRLGEKVRGNAEPECDFT